MTQAKTFPIRTTEEWLKNVRLEAEKAGISMHEYVIKAIEEKMERGE